MAASSETRGREGRFPVVGGSGQGTDGPGGNPSHSREVSALNSDAVLIAEIARLRTQVGALRRALWESVATMKLVTGWQLSHLKQAVEKAEAVLREF